MQCSLQIIWRHLLRGNVSHEDSNRVASLDGFFVASDMYVVEDFGKLLRERFQLLLALEIA